MQGLEVYHSLKEAQTTLGRYVKWLDFQSYVHSSLFGRDAELDSVTYFSAYATFLAAAASPRPPRTTSGLRRGASGHRR